MALKATIKSFVRRETLSPVKFTQEKNHLSLSSNTQSTFFPVSIMASRIRIGLVGLSKSSTGISWASTAHLPYLHSPRGQAKYEIVAVCNSSIESARKAVIDFDLSPNTETYGDAAQLATNPNIDLVVCNVRVDRHHKIIRPSVEAGKAVFCEWPLAHDIDHVQDLVKLAHDKGGRTMIGLQGRFSPLILKVKDLLEQGRIGKVLSSDARVSGMTDDRAVFYSSMDYFTQREVGGNMVTIGIGHRELAFSIHALSDGF